MKINSIASSILALSFLALTACGDKAPQEPAAGSEPAAISSEPVVDADGSAPVSEESSEPAAAPSDSAAATSTGSIPAECEAYVNKVNACVEKMHGSNAQMAETFKKQMEDAKASWASIPDQEQLKNVCIQADQAFEPAAKQLGC